MPELYRGTIVDRIIVSPTYQELIINLDNPHRLNFQAGQFILISIPNTQIKRAYSILSSPANTDQIKLLIDMSPQGEGTKYLQSLQIGDSCEFLAPLGQFVLSENSNEEKLIFIATGSGLSPIKSMITWLLQARQDSRQISLHWGMRRVEDIFWVDDFHLMEKTFPNFHADIVLSQPPERWPLCKGHVNDCIATHYGELSKTGFYICGSIKMVEGIVEHLVDNQVSQDYIHHEHFG